jgi:hypothetical protein
MAFVSLRELQLNDTGLDWRGYSHIEQYMTRLEHVEMGFNYLRQLNDGLLPREKNASVETLNLDSNELSSWLDVCAMAQSHEAYVLWLLCA